MGPQRSRARQTRHKVASAGWGPSETRSGERGSYTLLASYVHLTPRRGRTSSNQRPFRPHFWVRAQLNSLRSPQTFLERTLSSSTNTTQNFHATIYTLHPFSDGRLLHSRFHRLRFGASRKTFDVQSVFLSKLLPDDTKVLISPVLYLQRTLRHFFAVTPRNKTISVRIPTLYPIRSIPVLSVYEFIYPSTRDRGASSTSKIFLRCVQRCKNQHFRRL